MKTNSRATMSDVAEASGVSRTTVSFVLNNTGAVGPETRDMVLRAARQLNYHPSAIARGLMNKRMNTLGVVLSSPEPNLVVNPYYSGILDGIIKVATREKQHVTFYTGLQWQGDTETLPAFLDRRVDGLLLLHPNEKMIEALAGTYQSFVIISRTSANSAVSSVDADNAGGAYAAVSHLLELGHRRIGLLGGEDSNADQAARTQGYQKALAAYGVAYDPALVINGFYHALWGVEGLGRLQRLSMPPTAIFCGNDQVAAGVYQACEQAGLHIPADLSIVGFDDTMPAMHLSPLLTTVHQPLVEIGAAATQMLLEKIEAGAADDCPAQKIVMETTLIVRGSTARLVLASEPPLPSQ